MLKDKTIKEAIDNKLVISFKYSGNNVKGEPFTLGVHSSTGNKVLSAYFISGYSKSNDDPKWRLYNLSKMTAIKITDIDTDVKRKRV
jgi:hypothetical protein